MGSKRKRWSYSAGERPDTVRVAERTFGAPVQVEVWDPDARDGEGSYIRKSLGFKVRAEDGELIPEARDRAEEYAKAQARKLAEGRGGVDGPPTVARILALYQRHRSARKSDRERRADERRAELWTRALGGSTFPERISLREWETFIDDRRTGAIDARGNPVSEDDRRPVSTRTVEADCRWLRYVFAWACDFRPADGSPTLLRDNPVTRRFLRRIPKDGTPRRPTATWDRYEAIRAKTDEVTMETTWNGKREERRSHLSEILDLAVATGRRLSAIRRLRYADLRLERTAEAPHGSIRWPADTDKAGKEHTVPLSPLGRRAVDRILRERPGVGDTVLFPAPKDPTEPVSRYLADRWLREAEDLAEVEPHDGSLWHAYRRMWATARKDLPAEDVAAAGGWSTVRMVSEVYSQADEETTLKVVLHEGRVREAR